MEFMVIVFRSRTQTLNFASIMKSYNIPCQIINTPRVINVSCGISIKFSPVSQTLVEQILQRRQFDTYGGIYKLKYVGNNIVKA